MPVRVLSVLVLASLQVVSWAPSKSRRMSFQRLHRPMSSASHNWAPRQISPFAPRPFAPQVLRRLADRDLQVGNRIVQRQIVEYDYENNLYIDTKTKEVYKKVGEVYKEGQELVKYENVDGPAGEYIIYNHYTNRIEPLDKQNDVQGGPLFESLGNQSGEDVYIVKPRTQINNLQEYVRYMVSNRYAFGQNILDASKFSNIEGAVEPSSGNRGYFYYQQGRWVISEGNHRLFKMHKDGKGAMEMVKLEKPLEEGFHTSLTWWVSGEEKMKRTKFLESKEDESSSNSLCIIC